MHNCLVGVGLRDQVKIGASGKVASGIDVVKRLVQGADYTNAARAMMMAVGCIQAQTCHTNTCPVGVATQDRRRQRALTCRTRPSASSTTRSSASQQALQVMASLGVSRPEDLRPHMLRRRVGYDEVASYAEIFHHLEPGPAAERAPGRPVGPATGRWPTPTGFTV